MEKSEGAEEEEKRRGRGGKEEKKKRRGNEIENKSLACRTHG